MMPHNLFGGLHEGCLCGECIVYVIYLINTLSELDGCAGRNCARSAGSDRHDDGFFFAGVYYMSEYILFNTTLCYLLRGCVENGPSSCGLYWYFLMFAVCQCYHRKRLTLWKHFDIVF